MRTRNLATPGLAALTGGVMSSLDPMDMASGACFAFDGANYDPGSSPKGAPNNASYRTTDAVATVETDGYFDDLLVSGTLKTGDFLRVHNDIATDIWTIYGVTVVATDVSLTAKIALA